MTIEIRQTGLGGRTEALAIDGVAGSQSPKVLLRRLGFEERIRGSHHLFRLPGVDVLINLQVAGGKAKPYQVRQVRVAIIKLMEGA